MVKKTVNQDDTGAYHLFYADGIASPDTDLTFFDYPGEPERRGTNAIVRTSLRVAGVDALSHWAERLAKFGVAARPVREVDGRLELPFEDPEGQRLALVDDGGTGLSHFWYRSDVPEHYQIRGLGPVTVSVPDLVPTHAFLVDVMAMRPARRYAASDEPGVTVQVYTMGSGGAAAEMHLRVEPNLRRAQGGAHHVAFRIADDAYNAWIERFRSLGVRSSGPVDRFYFRSLYAKEPSGILFEIATDGPGFTSDEALDSLGERLSLPPFLEGRRATIERGLKPL